MGDGQALSALRSRAPPSAAPSAEQDEARRGRQKEFQGSRVHPELQREHSACAHIYMTLFGGLYIRHHASQRLRIRS